VEGFAYTDWQLAQLGCQCPVHRYDVAYLCECSTIVAASSVSDHAAHRKFAFDSRYFRHGDEMGVLFDRLHVLGKIPASGSVRYEAFRERLGLPRLRSQ
jgi:hypothetical protein